jgi:hypothetical protein
MDDSLKTDQTKWLSRKPGYQYPHHWMYRNYGKASKCELENTSCTKKSSRYHWSNISGEYKKERADWQELCASCHMKFDYTDHQRKVTSTLKKGNNYAKRLPVTAIKKNGEVVGHYQSIADASRELGILITSISNCVRGYSKSAGGYIWTD